MSKRRRHVYTEIRWHRVIIGIMVCSVLVCAGVLTAILIAPRVGNLSITERRFYFVSTASNVSLADAHRDAENIRRMGGAGFVLNDGAAFRTVVAVYNNRANADSVAMRLSIEESFITEVFVRILPRISFNIGDVAMARDFAALFNEPFDAVNAFYRISLDLSEGRIAESHAHSSLTFWRGRLLRSSDRVSDFSEQFGQMTTLLSEFYSSILASLTAAAALNFGPTLPVNIRYITIHIIEEYYRIFSHTDV